MSAPAPAYLQWSAAELSARAEEALARLGHCDLCPRLCGVDRLADQMGYCRGGRLARVASWHAHMWEEPPISGWRGSGTIFFSNCTARCLFCQNYPISQMRVGEDKTPEQLARIMLRLQRQGCHNINLVTPTHYVPQIIEALALAREAGLDIPLLYNTSGYDRPETLRLLDGLVDIYLPDAKYADEATARRLSDYVDYVVHNRAALREMVRQVGTDLLCDEDDIAYRGVIIRHLVLPERLSQTAQVLRWIRDEIGPDVHLSLMAQYFPAHNAVGHAELGRRLTVAEYDEALQALAELRLEQGWQQELETDA